ncbi:TerC family protein [Paenibacillus sp. GCM10023252]|uniref:TerC family protein n=1 Tax=Paenibacillus sp. GCM10023252 TaxID=3252649 RepID=UPI003614D588
MELFSMDWLIALSTIVFIDLILAGDNAIVIGLAARRLPADQQKKAILYGSMGAVGIRIIATLGVVYLLNLPGLQLIGGVLLLWIAYKLLVQENEHDNITAGNTLGQSVRTIIIADAAMGIDNVIAVAGAANHNLLLVVLGLLISVPIIVWGSTLFIKLINRFPWIVYVGSAVLAYTAAKMITHDHWLEPLFKESSLFSWSFMILMIIVIISAGLLTNKKKQANVTRRSSESH